VALRPRLSPGVPLRGAYITERYHACQHACSRRRSETGTVLPHIRPSSKGVHKIRETGVAFLRDFSS
jgi:hypothetical protein